MSVFFYNIENSLSTKLCTQTIFLHTVFAITTTSSTNKSTPYSIAKAVRHDLASFLTSLISLAYSSYVAKFLRCLWSLHVDHTTPIGVTPRIIPYVTRMANPIIPPLIKAAYSAYDIFILLNAISLNFFYHGTFPSYIQLYSKKY